MCYCLPVYERVFICALDQLDPVLCLQSHGNPCSPSHSQRPCVCVCSFFTCIQFVCGWFQHVEVDIWIVWYVLSDFGIIVSTFSVIHPLGVRDSGKKRNIIKPFCSLLYALRAPFLICNILCSTLLYIYTCRTYIFPSYSVQGFSFPDSKIKVLYIVDLTACLPSPIILPFASVHSHCHHTHKQTCTIPQVNIGGVCNWCKLFRKYSRLTCTGVKLLCCSKFVGSIICQVPVSDIYTPNADFWDKNRAAD